MKNRAGLTPEQLLALTETLIREAPAFDPEANTSDADRRWLGKAEAILEACDSIIHSIEFRAARNKLGTIFHDRNALLAPLHTTYARLELLAPATAQGAFIPAGDTWNGYAAIVRLVQRQCEDLLVVDPYLDANFFLEFLPHSCARLGTRCLTTRRSENHLGLVSASCKWAGAEPSKSKPAEVRYAPNGSLHDRLIIIDRHEAWIITQSLKDIAKRSPASVTRVEKGVGKLKAEHYNNLWENCVLIG